MKLLIGKNSKILKKVPLNRREITAISHHDVENFTFNNCSRIYLFAWSKASQSENLKIAACLPLSRVTFISTIAVLSTHRRTQWNGYPKWKIEIEKIVIENGGSVVRLGVCDEKILDGLHGQIPYTDADQITEILEGERFTGNRIYNQFKLVKGRMSGLKSIATKFLGTISDILPNYLICQAPLGVISRIFKIFQYGYTRDALEFFKDDLQIGFGVLGQAFYKRCTLSSKPQVVVSYLPNQRLDNNGFRNSLIGYYRIGLAASWHAVSIVKGTKGKLRKKVPFYNKRPSPPSNSIEGHLVNINVEENFIENRLKTKHGQISIFSNRTVLAMGPIENSNIIRKIANRHITFSDHEVGIIGTISQSDAIKWNLVNGFGVLIRPGEVLIQEVSGYQMLLDCRPNVPEKHIGSAFGNAFYLDSTQRLLRKLIVGLSAARLNEAFFNKFGIGLKTPQIALCAQILVDKCILMSEDGVISRKRIPTQDLIKIQNELRRMFESFEPIKDVQTVDSQHILGGSEVFQDQCVSNLLSSGRVIVLGSPTKYKLGAAHHTAQIVDRIGQGCYHSSDEKQLL
jgi:hypothetical protein